MASRKLASQKRCVGTGWPRVVVNWWKTDNRTRDETYARVSEETLQGPVTVAVFYSSRVEHSLPLELIAIEHEAARFEATSIKRKQTRTNLQLFVFRGRRRRILNDGRSFRVSVLKKQQQFEASALRNLKARRTKHCSVCSKRQGTLAMC